MIDLQQLAVFHLARGSHASPDKGLCAMEAVAWLEGEKHSDQPACVCPVIGAYVRRINDYLPDNERQRLVPYLPRLIGTVGDRDVARQRAEYLAWQAIRVFVPAALDACGRSADATRLRAFTGTLLGARDAARDIATATTAYANATADAAAYATATAATTAAAATAAYDTAAPYAADAAAYAAAAPYAADAAAYAADAAAYAALAAKRINIHDLWFAALDGVLEIGPQARPLAPEAPARIAAWRERVTA